MNEAIVDAATIDGMFRIHPALNILKSASTAFLIKFFGHDEALFKKELEAFTLSLIAAAVEMNKEVQAEKSQERGDAPS